MIIFKHEVVVMELRSDTSNDLLWLKMKNLNWDMVKKVKYETSATL